MKVLIIHSKYSKVGGEEKVVETQQRILFESGIEVCTYIRDYHEMDNWNFGKIQSLFTSLYSRKAIKEVRQIIAEQKPDIAIIHNLMPIIPPIIIRELKRHNIPVLMPIHNFRLFCPIGLFFKNGKICVECSEKQSREWNCIKNKCEGTICGSIAFAVRNYWNRHKKYYDLVDKYLSVSEFQKEKLIKYGIDNDKIAIIPNCTKSIPEEHYDKENYIGFVGRLSHEKGINLFLDIASKMPEYTFRIAGAKASGLSFSDIPSNVELVGFLTGKELQEFYSKAMLILFTSQVWEAMPLTVIEAMANGTPVVSKNVSSLPEILDHGNAGLLFETADEAIEKIHELLDNEELRTSISIKARDRIDSEYSEKVYLGKLTSVINSVLENSL